MKCANSRGVTVPFCFTSSCLKTACGCCPLTLLFSWTTARSRAFCMSSALSFFLLALAFGPPAALADGFGGGLPFMPILFTREKNMRLHACTGLPLEPNEVAEPVPSFRSERLSVLKSCPKRHVACCASISTARWKSASHFTFIRASCRDCCAFFFSSRALMIAWLWGVLRRRLVRGLLFLRFFTSLPPLRACCSSLYLVVAFSRTSCCSSTIFLAFCIASCVKGGITSLGCCASAIMMARRLAA
mmetsp:Transcript_64891/g.154904  ORF Transcript_64891/g.154904 Transcript_64891/m.154904 type:complete len:245 (-) Transcript_64891:297-1031(-)